MTVKNLNKVISILEKEHGVEPWNWHTRQEPFQVLISTVLSQRTRDEMTDRAAQALFRRFPDPKSLAKAPLEEVEKLVRPANFYRTKARKVKEIARIVSERFSGVAPKTMEELCSLPGVGRKTASCTLLYGHRISRIPVDVHVQAISQRLGWTRQKDPDEIQEDLEKGIPEEKWPVINELMVKHGQTICHTRHPKCWLCPVERYCIYDDKRLVKPKTRK